LSAESTIRAWRWLKAFLLGQPDAPYAALARELNTSEGALKVAIHRLRKRYRELFRQEIADTVADPSEIESELRFSGGAHREVAAGQVFPPEGSVGMPGELVGVPGRITPDDLTVCRNRYRPCSNEAKRY
jgi:hypothetical protein